MKALNFKIKIILAAILIAGSGLHAQELKKELHKEFDTNKSTQFIIKGKFGNLGLNSWDKNQAVFDVVIKVKNKDDAKAQKIIDKLTVDFKQEGNIITVETLIGDKTGDDANGKVNFSIDIRGSLPAGSMLDVEHRFGSAEIGEFTGPVKLDISFGELSALKLTGPETIISTSYGEATVGLVENAKAEVSFGELVIQEANNLELQVNQGEFKAGSANNLSAEVNMGSFNIDLIKPGFEEISIELKAGDVILGIDKKAGFTVEAEMKMGSIDLPGDIEIISGQDSGMNVDFEAKYGDGKSVVSLEGKLGSVSIKLK